MVTLAQVRRLTIEARSDGADKVTRDLQGIADGQRAVAETGVQMAASEDKVSRSTLSVERQLQRLQGRIDPLFRATRELDSSMRILDRAVAQGSITETEHARALALVQTHYERTAVAAKSRATGVSRSVDYRNLSFQLNDVITMGMMGARPSQIIASQGGQVFQALQMAKGGVVGGLKEIAADITGLVTRFPLVSAGFAAAGLAAGAFYAVTRQYGPTTEEALKTHAELVKKIVNEYKNAAAAVGLGLERSAPAGFLAAQAAANRDALRVRYAREMDSLTGAGFWDRFGGIGAEGTAGKPARQIPELRQALEVFDKSAKAPADVRSLVSAVSAVRLSPDALAGTRKFADNLLDALKAISEIANQLPDAEKAIDAASRLRNVLAAKIDAFPGALRALTDAARPELTPFQQIDRMAQQALAQTTRRGERDDVERARTEALARLQRQLDLTKQSDDLATRAVMARTVAEKAEIAALQARIQAIRLHGPAGATMPETIQAEAAARARVTADAAVSARRTLEAAQISAGQVGLVGLPSTIANINARYAEMIRDATGAADAVAKLEQAQRLEIATATRAAQIAPIQQAQIQNDAQARALAVQAASFGQSAEKVGYLNEKLALYNQYIAQGVEITPRLSAAIEEQSRAAGHNAAMQDKMNKAQADAINRMDGFRSAANSAFGSVLDGDWSSALSSFRNFFLDQFTSQFTQGLFGRQGEAGGGAFGNVLMGLFGGGVSRGASASNPVYVSFGDGGLSALLGGTGKANGLLPASLSAANSNAIGVVGGIDALAIYRKAVSDIESSGNYGALGPLTKRGDRAYGAYQVMGANIPSWTKTALGYSMNPQQFLASPAAQDAVFNRYFSSFLSKHGNSQDAASMWFTGRPLAYGAGLSDVTGTTGSVYVDRFNQALGRATTGLEGFASSANKGVGQAGGVSYPASLPLTSSQAAMMPAGVSPYGAGWAQQQLSGLSGVFQQLTNGLGGMVDSFLPGFGSILNMLLNGMGSGGGSGLFGLLGGLFGGGWGLSGQAAAFGLYANGGVPPGGISAFRNTIVSRPTLFAFANGAGLMGEAGEEGILPLRRNGRGQLGVYAAIGPSEGAGGGNVNLSIGDVHVTVPEGTDTTNAAKIGTSIREELTRIVDSRLTDQLRSRGLLSRSVFR